MQRPGWKTLVFFAIIGAGAWNHWQTRPLPPRPDAGQLVQEEPRQIPLVGRPPEFTKNGYRLTVLAEYEVTARVLARKTYRFDRGADLSPLDFALGWGPMSDDRVLEHLDIS